MSESILTWVIFNIFIAVVFLFDILWSRGKIYGFKSSIIWTAIWTIMALIVNLWFFLEDGLLLQGNDRGLTFLTAYVAERALSFDNLFVFIIIFQFFKIPPKLQPLALTYGIIGALVARAVFIALGTAILGIFTWVMLIMGLFLIYTGIKLAFIKDEEVHPENNILLKFSKKVLNLSNEFKENKFIFRDSKGVLFFTPLFLVVLVLASTDVVFAVDSIPTVFGITKDTFIVWNSNMMAVVGMRPLYFLIQEMQNQFRFLKYGLSLILVFIGFKMSVEYLGEKIGPLINSEFITHLHINTYTSLGAIVIVIIGSILLSSLLPEKNGSSPIKN